MIIVSKALAIGMIVLSLAIGLVFFYVFSVFSKPEKKKYMEILTSQLINLVIFIWVGKILLHLPLFIQDPLAVLAYPGNSGAFYLAVLFTGGLVLYQWIRKKLDILLFAEACTHVFLVALFFYEFMQLMIEDNMYSLGYLILSVILLILLFLLRERVPIFWLLTSILIILSIGMLVLNLIYPFVAIFGYLIEIWFIIVFFIGCLSILILNERKRKS